MNRRLLVALSALLVCSCGPSSPPWDALGPGVLDNMPGDSSDDGNARSEVFMDALSPDSDEGPTRDNAPSDTQPADPGTDEVPGDQGGDTEYFETPDPVCPRPEEECRIGVYSSQTGTCGEQVASDGTPCKTGACQDGSCVDMCWEDDCPTWLVNLDDDTDDHNDDDVDDDIEDDGDDHSGGDSDHEDDGKRKGGKQKGDKGCHCNVLPTGSDFCVGDDGFVPCDSIHPGHRWWGQDAHRAAGDHSFVNNEDGTATDTRTGLVWAIQPSEPLGLNAAGEWCSNSIDLPGQNWRVPNIFELFTLVDAGEPDCMWDPVFGENCGNNLLMHWSSTQAYLYANFCTVPRRGNIEACEKTPQLLPVRCVRGGEQVGQLPEDRFVQFDEMVFDRLTGISWAKDIDEDAVTFKDALRACARKGQGWRLPTTAEIVSVIEPDYPTDGCSKWNDKLGKFCDEQLYFWTSTPNPVPTEPRSAFAAHVSSGHIHENQLSQSFRYRCVKTWDDDDAEHDDD